MRRRVSLVLLSGACVALPLSAQSSASGAGPLRVGVLAGLSSATFGGSDAENADRRKGAIAGVYLVKPLAGGLAFRPELLVAQKGAQSSSTDGDIAIKGTVKLTYLEVPFLLQLEGASASGVRPHAYVGPSVGFKLRCTVEASGGGFSINSGCADTEGDVRSVDIGGVVGAGIGFPVGALSATIGARYQHGLTDITDGAKIQNRALAIYASLEFLRR